MVIILKRIDGLMPVGGKDVASITGQALVYLGEKGGINSWDHAKLETGEAHICPWG